MAYKEYDVHQNIKKMNERIAEDYINYGIEWDVVAISWTDVEVDHGDERGIRSYHNPVVLLSRDVESPE